MPLSRNPWNARLAALAVLVASVTGILGVGLAPQAASAASIPTRGVVSITPSCYDVGFSEVLAVLTSPLGPVTSVSGTLSAWATAPNGTRYGGQVTMVGADAAVYHIYPGTYDVQVSAEDSQGTIYSYSGTVVMPACDGGFVGIQPDPNPDGGYLTFTNTSEVMSHGPNHAFDDPTILVTDPHAPIVGMAAVYGNANVDSYYFASADGGVYSDNAPFYGDATELSLHAPIVAMALTPDQGGYWLVGADGGVFAFGDAGYHGSLAGEPLTQPIVGMAVDQATGGYWLVARDGGVFAFDAPFYGSAASLHLSAPVVGIESAPSGTGYRLVASDGGVFSYNEPFYGSMGGQPLDDPVVGIAEDPTTGGYWIACANGDVLAFGAPFYGEGA